MVFKDNLQVFDAGYIDSIKDKPNHTQDERETLNAFYRYAYRQYTVIRDSVNPRQCKNLTISGVRARLQLEANLQKAMRAAKLNQAQIEYILAFNETYNKYIR